MRAAGRSFRLRLPDRPPRVEAWIGALLGGLPSTGGVILLVSDDARWQQLVGCAPEVDLTDACVATYVRSFGRGAFRRALTEEELAHGHPLLQPAQRVTAARQLVATEGHDPAFGARPLKRAIQRLVENPLARALLEGRFSPGSAIRIDADPVGGTLVFSSGGETVVTGAAARRVDARRTGRREPAEAARADEAVEAGGSRGGGERVH